MPARPASYKTVCARHKRHGGELRKLAGVKAPVPVRPAHLDMTDEQIDKVYWNTGKADRTRMKKQAATERLRIAVRKELSHESSID